MMRLELDQQEHEMLLEVVRSFLSELRSEVSHTDSRSFRDRLKDQEHVIKQLLVKLEGKYPGAGGGQ